MFFVIVSYIVQLSIFVNEGFSHYQQTNKNV